MWYFIVFSTLLLFFSLVSVISQQETNANVRDPPCFFNPLCTCSKSYPDLGRVTCKDIPLLSLPNQLNLSKVSTLYLNNNGLKFLEPDFLSKTGLFKIEIIQNSLREINKNSFVGLERSLWELSLKNNKLREVPNQSLRNLQKLKMLDLSGNRITSVGPDDWLGLENSLKDLIIGENKLSNIRPRTFSQLRQLVSLDLSRNSLLELDASVFKGGPSQLLKLNLAGNFLSVVPLSQISELQELKYLDLSFNLITRIPDLNDELRKGKRANLFLNSLNLDYNLIQYLPFQFFNHFSAINRTYLNGNPITYIEKDAFQQCKIRELHLADCLISELSTEAFAGLEKNLEVLNMEGNNITEIPRYFFKDYKLLRYLNLKNNYIAMFHLSEMFGESLALEGLDISHQLISTVHVQNLKKNNIRTLTISNFPRPSLTANDLDESLSQLEEIKITQSNIKSIKNHAFKNVRGLRKLDLSENSILSMESEAFSEVHSLSYLSLAKGLSRNLVHLDSNTFQYLTAVETLDLSNNRLETLPEKLFHSMKSLKVIRLEDNFLEFIPVNLFQEQIHRQLNIIQLSFNQLKFIKSQTFSDLASLRSLWLNDNQVEIIEKRAFVNLKQLRHLYLRGNEISVLKDESFQSLPELEKLDLAHNKLKTFNYSCLEQVGTLSSFSLNLSHNHIRQLIVNAPASDQQNFIPVNVNVKALDLSYNNISHFDSNTFRPVESSLTHLVLSHNKLKNLKKDIYGDLIHLQCIDVSHNLLTEIEDEAFRNAKSIQVMYLSNNQLQELPKQLFSGFSKLRILDMSHNQIRFLREKLFNDCVLEKLDLSHNQLTKMPVFSFTTESSLGLIELNLSGNMIATLPSPDAFARFKKLYKLNLSHNRITRIDDGTFSFLHRLQELDFSNNVDFVIDLKSQMFFGLDKRLKHLNMKNTSLNKVPLLNFPYLETLDLSSNKITVVPFELAHIVPNLRRLELANNKIATVPASTYATFSKLEYLSLSGNPVESFNLQHSFTLRTVDIRNISLDILEMSTLEKIPLLETLMLTVNQSSQGSSLMNLVKSNYGLRQLYIEVIGNNRFDTLFEELDGRFPPKLKNLVLVGKALKNLPRNLLQNVQSPDFNLKIRNTSVEEVGKEVISHAKRIRNLTLDIRSNELKRIYNPNTADVPNVAKKIFLLDIQLSDNKWICDCDIGWIEGWERKKRQYLCSDVSEECFFGSDDLRYALCSNRKPSTLSEVFKAELECEWNSSENVRASIVLEFLIINFFFIFLIM